VQLLAFEDMGVQMEELIQYAKIQVSTLHDDEPHLDDSCRSVTPHKCAHTDVSRVRFHLHSQSPNTQSASAQ
jgi:hypothetical protein